MQLCVPLFAIITVMARHKIFFSYSVPPYCKLKLVSSSDTFTSTPQALLMASFLVMCLYCIYLCIDVERIVAILICVSNGVVLLFSLHLLQSLDQCGVCQIMPVWYLRLYCLCVIKNGSFVCGLLICNYPAVSGKKFSSIRSGERVVFFLPSLSCQLLVRITRTKVSMLPLF